MQILGIKIEDHMRNKRYLLSLQKNFKFTITTLYTQNKNNNAVITAKNMMFSILIFNKYMNSFLNDCFSYKQLLYWKRKI
jgi:hypothetical protein